MAKLLLCTYLNTVLCLLSRAVTLPVPAELTNSKSVLSSEAYMLLWPTTCLMHNRHCRKQGNALVFNMVRATIRF